MLIVDTGPLVAYLNRNDPDHVRCAELLESRTDDLLVTPWFGGFVSDTGAMTQGSAVLPCPAKRAGQVHLMRRLAGHPDQVSAGHHDRHRLGPGGRYVQPVRVV